MREAQLERWCCQELNSQGFECVKVGHNGYPDRIVLCPDRKRFFWIEFKTESKNSKLRTAQIARIKNLKRRGDTVYIINSRIEFRKLINIKEWSNGIAERRSI